MNAPNSFRPAGSLPSDPLAPYAGPWNTRLAAHLLRRAGFGGSPDDVTRLAGLSMNGAVDSLVHFPPTDLPTQPEIPDEGYAAEAQMMQRGLAAGAGVADGNSILVPAAMAGSAAQASSAQSDAQIEQLKDERRMARRAANIAIMTWWLERMLKTPAPLQEKLTLFWHGHFTTAEGAKGVTAQDAVNQNNLYRSNALGNIRDLAQAVSRDPAMLKYLDNARSVKAHPNENYARELMELFTLGIGNYTEQDVRESARAFTGWTVRHPLRGGGFYENAAQHDDGLKTFLGHTGDLDGNDIVTIIFEQPACSKWFANKLLNFFVYNDPEPELIDAVAGSLVKNDFELAPVLSMLLRSDVFYSDRAYRALVKSPVEFVIGSYQLYGIETIEPQTLGVLNRMGQAIFHPPSVKGWDGGIAWLNSQTLLTRENFASALMASQQMVSRDSWLSDGVPANARAAVDKLVGTILYGDASAAAVAQVQAYLDGSGTSALGTLSPENFEERMRGGAYLTMAMPAYQLA
ncbi:MAG TPA: DUF1800 domain-containing protein [Candidatus Acidoferrales bacterium]|nr:DUF1800 domain-containing protein [Candidatus Acidoferrales bacterium]